MKGREGWEHANHTDPHAYVCGEAPPINQVLVELGTLILLLKTAIWIENLNSAWLNYPEKSWRK